MTMIRFTCQACHKRFKVLPDAAGQAFTCTVCGTKLRIPAPTTEARSIHLVCPACKTRFKVKLDKRGRSIKCRVCDHSVAVP